MTESVTADIRRIESDIMALVGVTGLEPPVWDADAELYMRGMTLKGRVSYRVWETDHPDRPYLFGELFRRVVCDRDGTLCFRKFPAREIEEAIDPYTMHRVYLCATALWWGDPV